MFVAFCGHAHVCVSVRMFIKVNYLLTVCTAFFVHFVEIRMVEKLPVVFLLNSSHGNADLMCNMTLSNHFYTVLCRYVMAYCFDSATLFEFVWYCL